MTSSSLFPHVRMWRKFSLVAFVVILVELLIIFIDYKRYVPSAAAPGFKRYVTFPDVRTFSRMVGRHGSQCRKQGFAQPHLPVTALISYPGSGNTWIRHLLQAASGIYTGSTYPDKSLQNAGFIGEGRKNGSVIAVKNHNLPWGKDWTFGYDRVLLLMRNPLHAGTAEFNRLRSGDNHVGVARKEVLEKFLPVFLYKELARWKKIYVNWLKVEKPLLLVEYEKLKEDPRREMTTVFRFLNACVSEVDLDCMEHNQEGRFHRKARPDITQNLDPRYLYNSTEAVRQIRHLYQQRPDLSKLSNSVKYRKQQQQTNTNETVMYNKLEAPFVSR